MEALSIHSCFRWFNFQLTISANFRHICTVFEMNPLENTVGGWEFHHFQNELLTEYQFFIQNFGDVHELWILNGGRKITLLMKHQHNILYFGLNELIHFSFMHESMIVLKILPKPGFNKHANCEVNKFYYIQSYPLYSLYPPQNTQVFQTAHDLPTSSATAKPQAWHSPPPPHSLDSTHSPSWAEPGGLSP